MTGNAELNSNSEIVNFATGQSKALYVIGLGGLNSKTLVRDAKMNMYSNYPLQQGQAYANVTVDWHQAFYFLAMENTVTISADIVNLERKSSEEGIQSGFEYSSESLAFIKSELWLQPGDSALLIVDGIPEKVMILDVVSDYKVFVKLSEDQRVLKANIKQLFTENPKRIFQNNSFKVNDVLLYEIINNDGGVQEVPATVKGINPDQVLLKYGNTVVEVKANKLPTSQQHD